MNVELVKDQIAERAYYLWQQQGCPEGKSLQNWLQAEAEVRRPPVRTLAVPAALPASKAAKRKARRH